jgi:hypothetical protein
MTLNFTHKYMKMIQYEFKYVESLPCLKVLVDTIVELVTPFLLLG